MLFLFRSAPEVEKRIHSKLFRKFWRSRGTKEPAYITVLRWLGVYQAYDNHYQIMPPPSKRVERHQTVPPVDEDHAGLRLLDVLVVGERLQNLSRIHLFEGKCKKWERELVCYLLKVDIMRCRLHLEGRFVWIPSWPSCCSCKRKKYLVPERQPSE